MLKALPFDENDQQMDGNKRRSHPSDIDQLVCCCRAAVFAPPPMDTVTHPAHQNTLHMAYLELRGVCDTNINDF